MDTRELYYEIKKRATLRGETMTSVAGRHKVLPQNLHRAFAGLWTGEQAKLLILEVCKEFYLEPPPECLELEVEKEGA